MFIPYDVYERHKKVATFIKDSETVVDVGGELNHLSQFANPAKIVVANLKTGDVIISKDRLPFEKSAFDVVCAIDVLEHIPKRKRNDFVNRLLYIASKRVILSFPLGTKRHILYEIELQKQFRKKGRKIVFLDEHVKYGLPKPSELSSLAKGHKSQIFYSGDLTWSKYMLRFYMLDPKVRYIGKLIYLIKLVFNAATNPLFYLFFSKRSFSESVNRAYLIIDK